MGNSAIAVRGGQEEITAQLSAQSRALLSLLPGDAAVRRFQRVTMQAIGKTPALLECTPDSLIAAVMEAAAMGLEPTGGVGGAHLVPRSVNTGTHDKPRWEKRATLVPDYRGVVKMVTRPRADGTPSGVVSVEARCVKEGDEFAYSLGSGETVVTHAPSMDAARSQRPTTHVYAVARLRSGGAQVEVMDRAEVEAIRQRERKRGASPWDTDWDEMAKKTAVKRLAKLLPVEPEVRAILAREDEPEPEPVRAPSLPPPATATARLAAKLAPRPEPVAAAQPEPVAAAQPEPVAADDADVVEVPDDWEPAEAPKPAPDALCGSVAAEGGVMAGAVCTLPSGHQKAHRAGDAGTWPR